MKRPKSVRILSALDIKTNLERMARAILRQNKSFDSLGFIGIRTRGLFLARRLCEIIKKYNDTEVPLGEMDITLYRDDLSTVGAKPVVNRTDLPGDIENRNIVLIDDVLYTGRTIRAALDQLIDYGRPRRVQLAVLIDRGKEHRELPIQADYIGKLVPTKKSEIIKVMLQEFDEEEGVVIVERPATETS